MHACMHACKEIINREVQFKHVKKLLQYILSRACASWHCICMQRAFRFDGNSNTYIHRFTNANKRGKKKQTKADKGREKYIRELEVYTYHAHLMGLWNRELRLQCLRCAWILLHPRLRMEKSMNELRRCKWLKARYIVWKNRHEKNGDAHLTGLWDRYVRLHQYLRHSWVLLHARRLYNQSINEDDENDSRIHSNLKMKKRIGGSMYVPWAWGESCALDGPVRLETSPLSPSVYQWIEDGNKE